jgi:hypothetical protein
MTRKDGLQRPSINTNSLSKSCLYLRSIDEFESSLEMYLGNRRLVITGNP